MDRCEINADDDNHNQFELDILLKCILNCLKVDLIELTTRN